MASSLKTYLIIGLCLLASVSLTWGSPVPEKSWTEILEDAIATSGGQDVRHRVARWGPMPSRFWAGLLDARHGFD
ncbi:unnamed protein product [Allacma fusca]|uniref:Uncharacterized protein n=1 Tax=Allacma fusca TaxID=39272 RepID=A0A8J2P025_9HEXA|nr:unnamed protein product [Allacma fusca]